MATALSLDQAAGQAFDNLQIRWFANQLKTAIIQFCQQTLIIFPQSQVTGNPVSNWITVFWSLGEQMPSTNVPIEQLTFAAEILYRLCWMAFSLIGNGINAPQGSALLTRYNLLIGF